MKRENAIRLFNEKQVRVHWDSEQEKWYFSIVDVIGVLTDSPNPRKYWSVLKTRLKKESSQLATNCSQLKMQSSDEITKAWSGFSSKEKKSKTFKTSKKIAKQGGTIAGNTRKEIEEKTGKRVISSKNANEIQSKSVKKISNETK